MAREDEIIALLSQIRDRLDYILYMGVGVVLGSAAVGIALALL